MRAPQQSESDRSPALVPYKLVLVQPEMEEQRSPLV
jgi:hypothetical protein